MLRSAEVTLLCFILPIISSCDSDPSFVAGLDAQPNGEDGGRSRTCPATQTLCGAECANLQSNPNHCGECAKSCAPTHVCADGSCRLSCQDGFIACEGSCIDPTTNRTYCGASGDCMDDKAGETCADGFICNGAGVCELSCQQGLLECDGTCVDPETSRAYCGASGDCTGDEAGETCADGFICNGAGVCELSCQEGMLECDGICVDPLEDERYCGAGPDCTSNPGDVCPPGEVCNGAGVCDSCPAGMQECNGSCTDVETDASHCGTCGHQCPTEFCEDGECAKQVFVTSTSHTGDLGGVTGADEICQDLASAAGLSGTYLAWLGNLTIGSPSERFSQFDGPYVLVDGTQVANDWDDLTNQSLDNAIDLTELGNPATASISGRCGVPSVWTGAGADGSWRTADNCDNWTSSSSAGRISVVYGDLGAVDKQWTDGCYRFADDACDIELPFYCFEQ